LEGYKRKKLNGPPTLVGEFNYKLSRALQNSWPFGPHHKTMLNNFIMKKKKGKKKKSVNTTQDDDRDKLT